MTPEATCRACGACCTLHVSFHAREIDRDGGEVPAALVEPARVAGHVAMRSTGTDRRCVALRGVIGADTHCAIYATRPSPCRAFEPSWLTGEANAWCDDARVRHGLAPLAPSHWG